MAWLLSATNLSLAHCHQSPTILKGSGKEPSLCCMAVPSSVSFSSNAGTVDRTVSHAADAWHTQLRRRTSHRLPASAAGATDYSSGLWWYWAICRLKLP
jgi:hypothetical protein